MTCICRYCYRPLAPCKCGCAARAAWSDWGDWTDVFCLADDRVIGRELTDMIMHDPIEVDVQQELLEILRELK